MCTPGSCHGYNWSSLGFVCVCFSRTLEQSTTQVAKTASLSVEHCRWFEANSTRWSNSLGFFLFPPEDGSRNRSRKAVVLITPVRWIKSQKTVLQNVSHRRQETFKLGLQEESEAAKETFVLPAWFHNLSQDRKRKLKF
jgi:hypothetical protein